MKPWFTRIIAHRYLIILVVFFSFLFFYRMHWPTLGSWDEAWYASISREMAETGQMVPSIWNGKPFYDHPPMGFWIVAISYQLFGVSEFATRLPSALMGLGSIVLMYLVGVTFFKKKEVGFAAAVILGTCVWYVIRVRSGNLDSPFVFFYILSIYLALLSVQNIRLFPLVGLSFGALMMTKTLVGASALPVIGLIMLPQVMKIRQSFFWLLGGVATFLMIVAPWYWYHFQNFGDFYQHHFVNIGTRNKTADSYFQLEYALPLFYLHMGVRKWYYLWQIATGYLVLSFRFIKNRAWIVILWNLFVLYPFLTTDQTQLWHLIPVYIPLSLLTAYGLWDGGNLVVTILKKIPIQKKIDAWREKLLHPFVISASYLVAILFIAGLQFKTFYQEVFPTARYTPDDVAIAQEVGKYNETIYLDDDFLPMAVYYSGRTIKQMAYEPEERKTLVNLFNSSEQDFVVITRAWAVNNLIKQDIPYKVLEENESFAILTRPDDL